MIIRMLGIFHDPDIVKQHFFYVARSEHGVYHHLLPLLPCDFWIFSDDSPVDGIFTVADVQTKPRGNTGWNWIWRINHFGCCKFFEERSL